MMRSQVLSVISLSDLGLQTFSVFIVIFRIRVGLEQFVSHEAFHTPVNYTFEVIPYQLLPLLAQTKNLSLRKVCNPTASVL